MIEWLKQQYNDLLFKLFPVMPSYIARECYEEFDEKYKEFRIMTENKRFTVPIKYRLSHSKIQLNGTPLTNDEIIRVLNTNDGAFFQNFALKRENKELKKENEQLKLELQGIYDVATLNKARDIVDKIYDDLLYETSEKSDYARNKVLECLKKLDEFGDELND